MLPLPRQIPEIPDLARGNTTLLDAFLLTEESFKRCQVWGGGQPMGYVWGTPTHNTRFSRVCKGMMSSPD